MAATCDEPDGIILVPFGIIWLNWCLSQICSELKKVIELINSYLGCFQWTPSAFICSGAHVLGELLHVQVCLFYVFLFLLASSGSILKSSLQPSIPL